MAELSEAKILEIIGKNPEIREYIERKAVQQYGVHVKKSAVPTEVAEKYGERVESRRGTFFHYPGLDAEKIGNLIRHRIDPHGWSCNYKSRKKNSYGHAKVIGLNELSYAQYEIYAQAFMKIADALHEIGDGERDYYDKDGIKQRMGEESGRQIDGPTEGR
jgi:hypothetical protein